MGGRRKVKYMETPLNVIKRRVNPHSTEREKNKQGNRNQNIFCKIPLNIEQFTL